MEMAACSLKVRTMLIAPSLFFYYLYPLKQSNPNYMKIAIVGTGYVGLVSGACLADMGAQVSCVDIDQQKIDNLNKGIIPIYEPGLEELVKRNVEADRLQFTTSLPAVLDEVEIVFSAVGTPPKLFSF